MIHAEMLIAGHFVGGSCDQTTGKAVMKSPWNGRTIGTAAEGGANDVEAAIAAAQEAFPVWSRTPVETRAKLLGAIAEKVRGRRQDLAELLVEEIGKPITWALAEVDRMAVTFDLSAEAARTQLGPFPQDLTYDKRGGDYEGLWQRVPLGPTLCIIPWNWPYNLGAHKIGPALAVGNTIVLKPSSRSPISSLSLARLIHEAGCPPGVLNAVNIPGALAQKAARDPRVKKVSFTGSPPVGWKLKEMLPKKAVTLELGGDASVIVLEDGDLELAAARSATSAFGYAGQVCISAQHIWAVDEIYDEFREHLIRATLDCPAGDPHDPQVVCGPLIDSEAADKVMDWVDEAVSGGGRLLAGARREGNLVSPTLVEGVPAYTRLASQEVFGPVLTLDRVNDLDEAILRTNASNYGIHASVFTRSRAFAEKAMAELEVGGVVINDYPSLRFDGMPYGGVKESGFGREGVRFAVAEMSLAKSYVRRREPSWE